MDLQTIRENIRQKKYKSRKDFLEDVHQIVQNSSSFNGMQYRYFIVIGCLFTCNSIILLLFSCIYLGPDSPFTINAGKMLNLCVKRMGQQEEELIRLEETTNPDEDDDKEQSSITPNTTIPAANVPGCSEPFPKAMVDLSISESEDEPDLEAGYLDGRA